MSDRTRDPKAPIPDTPARPAAGATATADVVVPNTRDRSQFPKLASAAAGAKPTVAKGETARFRAGTRAHESRKSDKSLENYTDEQHARILEIDTGEHALRIARAEFANHVLLPDGTITEDLDVIRTGISELVAAAESARATAHTSFVNAQTAARKGDKEAPELRKSAQEALRDANRASSKARAIQQEFEEHVAEDRFLFIVDEHGLPVVYFQTAVEGNPDTPMLKSEDTPEYREKVRLDVARAAEADREARFAAGTQTEADEETRWIRSNLSKIAKVATLVIFAVAMAHFGGANPLASLGVGSIVGFGLALSYKTSTGNYLLDQTYDNKFPASSLVNIRTGGVAGADNADTGTLLVQITTPATPWAAASAKSKAKSGTWSGTASGTGTAAHYRFTNSGDTEREEGTVTATGGGGDMTLDNTSIASSQAVTIGTFTRTAP